MHRISKALLEGCADIEAVRFVNDPDPDYVAFIPTICRIQNEVRALMFHKGPL